MKYNAIINCFKEDDADADEPVTLAEVKELCVIADDNTDDDELLESLIITARELVERKKGIALVPGIVTTIFRNDLGNFDLPYFPVTSAIVLTDENDVVIPTDDYKIAGTQKKFLKTAFCEELTAVYEVGYDSPADVPQAYKTAVLAQVDFMFKNRGETKVSDYVNTLL